MLDELVVENLGVIDSARLEPGVRFTVITGETGAGKTLLLGALRLLLGDDADQGMIGPFGDESIVDGRFMSSRGQELAARRRLPKGGRSRAYIDGAMASAAALDQATENLVEIIGQHDQLVLVRPGEARRLVDRLLDENGKKALDEYRSAWNAHENLLEARRALGGDRGELIRRAELSHHQAAEIRSAGFSLGDDKELENRLNRLRNAEELRGHLSEALNHLEDGRERVGLGIGSLRKAALLDPTLTDALENMDVVEGSFGETLTFIRTIGDDLDAEPAELDAAEERMRLLSDLKRKYGSTLEEVLEFERSSTSDAESAEALLERAERIDSDVDESAERLAVAGARLIQARREAATRLAALASEHLTELGFSTPVLAPEIEPAAPAPFGADSVKLLFASDERLTPGEISKVASGGELSRLVLALRLAGGSGDAETLVFDEVDAGIGGATALAVGRKLSDLAEERQVLCVTHLPQVAAFGDVHYVVSREDHRAELRRVNGEERVAEIARMLAGLSESERGRSAAEELLELGRQARTAQLPN